MAEFLNDPKTLALDNIKETAIRRQLDQDEFEFRKLTGRKLWLSQNLDDTRAQYNGTEEAQTLLVEANTSAEAAVEASDRTRNDVLESLEATKRRLKNTGER